MHSSDARSGQGSITILLADDDEDDRLLTAGALKASRLLNDIRFVVDGEDLMHYLYGLGAYVAGGTPAPRPGLILLDLNMPKMDGREALARIKGDPDLRRIPIVVLTTSKAEADVLRTYDLGTNSFITKPITFTSLVEVARVLGQYWFQIVTLPAASREP